MDDWWLCFDAINIVDEEIKASNALLAAYGKATLPARQVFGANTAADLAKKVEASGWTPVDTSIRVTNVPGLIKRFGGAELYGDDAEALLRELIQNAADAIRARRRRDSAFINSNQYAGSVSIRVSFPPQSEMVDVSFEDDGIGMPVAVLTGPLLDFGTSFWNTELASQLYPGLQSDPNFAPAGKYGIGFFSSFMYSNDVRVISRPFSKGIDDLLVLAFRFGPSGRAELRRYDTKVDGPIQPGTSTLLKTKVKFSSLIGSVTPQRYILGTAAQIASYSRDPQKMLDALKSFLGRLCFALDVSVNIALNDGPLHPVNFPFYRDWSNTALLTSLHEKFGVDEHPLPTKLADLILPLINDDGGFGGRACVSISRRSRHSVKALDGFCQTSTRHSDYYEGVVEFSPNVVSREGGEEIADDSCWEQWATSQLAYLSNNKQNFSKPELLNAAIHLADFPHDILPIAHCIMDERVVSLAECAESLRETGSLVLLAQETQTLHGKGPVVLGTVGGFCRAIEEELGHLEPSVSFVHSDESYMHDSYYRFSEPLSDLSANNVLSCLLRLLNKLNLRYTVGLEEGIVIGKYSGYSSGWIDDGANVEVKAVVVKLQNTTITRSAIS